MTSDPTPGDDGRNDLEWAWFADAYRRVPPPRLEAITRATQAMQASVTTWHTVHFVLRWALGMAAVVGVAVGGYSAVKFRHKEPVAVAARAADPTLPDSMAPPQPGDTAFERLRAKLGPNASHDQLVAGAYLVRHGVNLSQLGRMEEHIALQHRSGVAMQVLLALAGEGVPGGEAAEAVLRRLHAGISDAELLALRAQVSAAIARGVPPLDALHDRFRRPGDPAAQIPSPSPRP